MALYENLKPLEPRYSLRQEPVLSALFNFLSESKQLRYVWVSGPFITDRADKLAKEVDEHPEWPDARVVKALKGAGAKFGPDDRAEFLRALPLKELEPCTGRLEVVSADFGVRLDHEDGEKPKSDLRWVVKAKAYSLDGRYETDCSMIFEPFEGALVDFSIDSAPKPVQ